jgi:hypothetical protein
MLCTKESEIKSLYTPRRNFKAVEAELHSIVILSGLSDQPHSSATFSAEKKLPLLIK